MPSFLTRILLCVSSYFPLAVIFAVHIFFKGWCWLAAAVLIVGVVGLLGMLVYLKIVRRLTSITVQIESLNRRDGEAMSYIVSYLLPFIALPSRGVANGISLGVFLLVLGVLYVNSDMIYINPMLNIFGWHIYDVKLANGETRVPISRLRERKRRGAQVIQMGEDIFLEVEI